MKLLPHLAQGTPAWHAWRAAGLGGSDAATVLGLAPWPDATPALLLKEKVEGWQRETNFAMRRGTRLEPEARALYERLAGCMARPVCVEHDEYPWARVSLDGLCRPRVGDGDPWVLEIKCPGWQGHSAALAGEVPDYYRPQCQWQLLVTGLGRLDYASYSTHSRFGEADRLAVVRVEPDAEMQGRLAEACERFWGEVLAARATSQVQAAT